MTLIVNTVILMMVFGLMAFFALFKVTFLVYFSIPTICVYLIGYFLILHSKLDIYVWMVYFWLTLYMGVTTICVGYHFGFHLYCMSMIPVMFVTEFIAYKLEQKSLKARYVSISVCLVYLVCTGYVAFVGPIYQCDQRVAGFFWIINSLTVFGFLIHYSGWLIRMVIHSENNLTQMAHNDRLTGLFNRHYMMEVLEDLKPDDPRKVLAIADLDTFKQINDTYGHNAGDYILKEFSKMIQEDCSNCVIGRWGGEEFLILLPDEATEGRECLESFRKRVEGTDFTFEGKVIRVTVTIGIVSRENEEPIDNWIQRADKNMYFGKNNGRNQVVGP